MNLKYAVFVNAEDKGTVLSTCYRTDDESQAVQFYNKAMAFYGKSAVYVISLKRWKDDKYKSIKTELS